jgi:hypothetical protein
MQNSISSLEPSIARGVKLTCPSGTSNIVKTITKSLAHSLSSNLVLINRKIFDLIRQHALKQSIPKSYLSNSKLFYALRDLIETDDQPHIICLQDELSFFAEQKRIAESLISMLKNQSSKIFFLLFEPDDALAQNSEEGRKRYDMSSAQSRISDKSGNDDIMRTAQFRFPWDDGNKIPGPPPQQGQTPIGGLPSMPSGMSFHIVVKNGSASIMPIANQQMPMPPFPLPFPGQGMPMPPGLVMGANGPNSPMPPEMGKVFEFIQRKMQERAADQESPLHGLSAEDIQEFMKDPESQSIMKVSRLTTQ